MPPDGPLNCFLNSLIILFSSAQSFGFLTFDRLTNGLLLLKPAPRLLLRDLLRRDFLRRDLLRDLLPWCLFLRNLLLDLLFFIYI